MDQVTDQVIDVEALFAEVSRLRVELHAARRELVAARADSFESIADRWFGQRRLTVSPAPWQGDYRTAFGIPSTGPVTVNMRSETATEREQ